MGLMALLAGNALTSCSIDDELQAVPEGQKGYVEFSLSRGAETRTAYALNDANGLNVTWSEGDKVVVETITGDIIEVFDLVSGAGTATASFAKSDSQLADKSGNVLIINAPGYSSEMDPKEYFVDLSDQEGKLDDLWKYDYFIFNATLNNGKIQSPEFQPVVAILHFPKDIDLGITAPKADLVFRGGDNKIGPLDAAGDITVKDVSLTDGKLDDDIYVAVYGTGTVPTSLKVSNKTFALPAIAEAGKIYNFAKSNLREMNKEPLTLEAVSDGTTITVKNPGGLVMSYMVNGSDMETSTAGNTSNITIAVNAGDKVKFFGNNPTYCDDTDNTNITSDKECFIYGNIMSLIDADNFGTATELIEARTFSHLFENNTRIKNHDRMALILPATTLASDCYNSMFSGCTGLTKAPELPATTLASDCYVWMFYGCTGLTKAPELPATTLADECYSGMFYGCTSLTKAPELPAKELKNYCYSGMFYNCTSLTKAPELPAKELKNSCYKSMFYGCTSLNYLKCLATSIASDARYSPTYDWLRGVPASGTFVKDASAEYGSNKFWDTTSKDGSPYTCAAKVLSDGNWTVSNAK